MKRSSRIVFSIFSTTLPAVILALGIAAPAIAQMTPHAVGKVDNYLDTHPGVARRLQADPSLIDNKKFVANHPGLHDFLQNHPGVREQWKAAGARSMPGPEHYGADPYGGGLTHHQRETTDNYFDRHQEVARELRTNPDLINNKQWVDNHPGLHEFMQTHPNISRDFRNHPYHFEKGKRRYEHHEGAHS